MKSNLDPVHIFVDIFIEHTSSYRYFISFHLAPRCKQMFT
nr:MAG TPA: hypothetical protein [Caudoviricetes sp.]